MTRLLDTARDILSRHGVVVGPSDDGEYMDPAEEIINSVLSDLEQLSEAMVSAALRAVGESQDVTEAILRAGIAAARKEALPWLPA